MIAHESSSKTLRTAYPLACLCMQVAARRLIYRDLGEPARDSSSPGGGLRSTERSPPRPSSLGAPAPSFSWRPYLRMEARSSSRARAMANVCSILAKTVRTTLTWVPITLRVPSSPLHRRLRRARYVVSAKDFVRWCDEEIHG